MTWRLPRLQSHRVSNAMSDKVLVTGASGLAGASLVRALLAQGREVRAMVHADRRALAGLDVEPFAADVRDPASLERAMAGVDVVYHLAATVSVAADAGPAIEAVNVAGTRNVVAACLRGKVRRLVHFSSIEALRQDPLDQPVDETRARIDSEGDAPTSSVGVRAEADFGVRALQGAGRARGGGRHRPRARCGHPEPHRDARAVRLQAQLLRPGAHSAGARQDPGAGARRVRLGRRARRGGGRDACRGGGAARGALSAGWALAHDSRGGGARGFVYGAGRAAGDGAAGAGGCWLPR